MQSSIKTASITAILVSLIFIVVGVGYFVFKEDDAPAPVTLQEQSVMDRAAAIGDAEKSAASAETAAKSARKAAGSTRESAKSAEDAARDAANSAKDAAKSAEVAASAPTPSK